MKAESQGMVNSRDRCQKNPAHVNSGAITDLDFDRWCETCENFGNPCDRLSKTQKNFIER